MVISHIAMGYLVTLARTMRYCVCDSGTARARWWFVPVL